MPRKRLAPALLSAAVVLLAAQEARPGDVSLRAGAYADADGLFVGVEYRTPVDGRLQLAPNVEVVFPDGGTDVSLNADLHYLLPTHGRLTSWIGGGLAIYVRDQDAGNDTSVGVNLIGALGLRAELAPYAQFKVVLKDDTEVVLGFGIRF
jgi:hypothetical protein